MWMSHASLTSSPVDVLRPGTRLHAVLGEIDEGLSELLVAASTERHMPVFAGGARRRSDAGRCGERRLIGEPLSAVPDLRKEQRRAVRTGPRERGEDHPVRVQLEGLSDPLVEHLDAG